MGFFQSKLINKSDILEKLYSYDHDFLNSSILIPLFNKLKINIKNKLKIIRGAFIYLDESENVILFIYKKMDPDELKLSLPISFKENNVNCYITLFIDENGRDYIGQSSMTDINNIIFELNNSEKTQLSDILDMNYSEIKEKIPNLTLEEYNYKLQFSIEQLNIKHGNVKPKLLDTL